MLILFFAMQLAKSQSFDKKSSWTLITTNRFDHIPDEISTYKVDGDTLIDDQRYSKIFRNDNFYSALRETEDNKIYARFPDFDRELLIYDFDWHPNDTLYHNSLRCQDKNSIHAILGSEIDSIQLLDGKYYKYVAGYRGLASDCFTYVGETIIRGIGDARGFFYSTYEWPTDGSQYALLCFYIDDILVYSNPDFSYCNFNSTNMIINNDSNIKLYPNPSNHSITVEFVENLTVDTFQLVDTKGSLIKTYEVNGQSKIEMQNLAKGIYVYSAISTNNKKLSGKIIIK